MGFRLSKSIKLAPGVRMSFTKSGIGYSVGGKGYRMTKRAGGGVRHKVSVPGTGVSYTTSPSRRARRPSTAAAHGRTAPAVAPTPPPPAQPGLFAPRGEKRLYRALHAGDVEAVEAVAAQCPSHALVARTLAGAIRFADGDDAKARHLFSMVFGTGIDPSHEPFMIKYVTVRLTFEPVPGALIQVPLDRSGVGLALAELHQGAGGTAKAIEVVEQLEPTAHTALSLAELYSEVGRHDDVVQMTEAVRNNDDATSLLCTFRGTAFREQGYFDAARASFKEALKSKQRDPATRHRALFERSKCYKAERKNALARRDLEHILAENSLYEGLDEALNELT